MKRYKVHEVIEMLEADGWFLEQEILNSIWKQAGWK